MEAGAAILATFAIFFLLAFAIRSRTLRPGEARLRAMSPRRDLSVSTSDGAALLRRNPNTIVSRLISTSEYSQRWTDDIERAGLNIRPSEYFLIRLALAGVTVALITAFGRSSIAFLISLPLGLMAYMAPALWLKLRIQRRLGAIDKQLVETVTLIANALRAGFAFSQGIDVAAKRIGPPMSVELGRLLLDVNLGMSTEAALTAMNERIGSDDLDMVVTAILIQRTSGGNLAEVLESVAETMRERERLRGEIKTMTASQRFTGAVLSAWPALLGLVFFVINPDMMSLMWTTSLGLFLLAAWVILNVTGIFALRRILDIDI